MRNLVAPLCAVKAVWKNVETPWIYRYPMSPWSEALQTTLSRAQHAPARRHASEGLDISKEEGEWSMPGQGISGENSLRPGWQCQSSMVQAGWLASQFGGMYSRAAASGELQSRVGLSAWRGERHSASALPSHPPSRGRNERTGHRRTTERNHAAMQDRLRGWNSAVFSPVWRRSPHRTQRLPVMGCAAKQNVDQPK